MQESRLLGTWLPSTPVLHGILDKIRQKYNIPEVLPGNKQLAATLRAERTREEWQAVFDDLEREIRAEIQLLPPELDKMVQGVVEIINKSTKAKFLEGATVEVTDPAFARLVELFMTNAMQAVQYLNQVYKGLAERMFDHLITGRPIELPEKLVNIVGVMRLNIDDEPEPLVIAVAHQLSNPDEITRIFRARIVETFGEKPSLKDIYLDTANYLALWNTDRSLDDVVMMDMEQHPEDYEKSKAKRTSAKFMKIYKDRMRQRITRLQDTIDKITGYKK